MSLYVFKFILTRYVDLYATSNLHWAVLIADIYFIPRSVKDVLIKYKSLVEQVTIGVLNLPLRHWKTT